MGATLGSAVEITVPVGGSYPVHRHRSVERVVYVVAGVGTHSGSRGPLELESDDVLCLPPGSWHGFQNRGESPATLWIIYAPSTTFPSDDYEEAVDLQTDGELSHRKLHAAVSDPTIATPEHGFDNLNVIWDGASGAAAITLGVAKFAAGGRHRWHRHPHGDEFFRIVSGTAPHVTDTHGPVTMKPGESVFSPAGEWHMMPAEEPVHSIFVYIGGASLAEVGYELREKADER
jgi:quercetin dioxygenase-like cupin family protein